MLEMRKFYWILPVLIGHTSHLCAQTVEEVHLSDGSVLEGFICEQVPGKSLSVQVTSASLVANSDSLMSSSERHVPVASLPAEWKSWVMSQPTAISNVALSTLKFRNTEYKDVLVTENGPMIHFTSLANRVYPLPWFKVTKTVKLLRPDGVVSGLEDVIVLKDGTRIAGQITEQVPGKTIKIVLPDNTSTLVNASLVASIEAQPLSEQLSLFQQAALLDQVYTRQSSEPMEGVIISRQPGKQLMLLSRDGNETVIPLGEVVRYGKVKNPAYKMICDRQLEKGQVILNGDTNGVWFAPLKAINGYFVLDDASALANPGDEIVVEANLEDPTAAIHLIRAYRQEIPVPDSKNTMTRDVFTYQDLIERALPIQREQTPLGNTKLTFKVSQAGDYVLSIRGLQGFIVIHVE